jgi:hypothetical protein
MTSVEPLPEKPASLVEYVETTDDGKFKSSEAVLDAATKGQIISGYETLGLWETVKTFKFSSAVCFAAAFSAGTDGYQIGSVRDNPSPLDISLHEDIILTPSAGSTPASSPIKGSLSVLRLKLARMVSPRSPRPSSAAGAPLCPSARSSV